MLTVWQSNSERDQELPCVYDWEMWTKKAFYLQDSWLDRVETPKILITGANNWLGHYLLHIFTERISWAKIVAWDVPKPQYLSFPRYKDVQYASFQRRMVDLRNAILDFHPHLIIHCDYIWNFYEKRASKIYELNVCEMEALCEAAVQAGVNRVISFSDFVVYGPGKELATEDTELVPTTLLGKSFKDGEQIAQYFHNLEKTQIYTLRLAPVYGQAIPSGVMAIAKLIRDGILLGPPENGDMEISILYGQDMALAAFLLALAPNPGYRVFNLAGETVTRNQILQDMAALLPVTKLMGIETRLASIMKVGYQQNVAIPEKVLEFMAQFSQQSNNFLNQLRAYPQNNIFTPKILQYWQQARHLSNKRVQDILGWQPVSYQDSLRGSLSYACRSGWYFEYMEFEKNASPLSPQIEILDGVTNMVESVIHYTPSQDEPNTFVKVPLLDIEIDIKSLWILVERSWSFLWLSIIKGDGGRKWDSMIPKLVSMVGENLMNLVRYHQIKASSMFPNNSQKQIEWLTKQVGSLNQKKLRFYATIIVLSEIISLIHKKIQVYTPMMQLLPDKNYGIFCASEVGDIGVTIQIENCKAKISFARKDIDAIAYSLPFAKRILEFKKMVHSHIVLGIKLESLFHDFTSGKFSDRFMENLGKSYLLSESTDYYHLIGTAIKKTQINTYLFLDAANCVVFGLSVKGKGKGIEILPPSYIQMVNRLLSEIKDYKEIIQMFNDASHGEEQIAFFRIQTIRRLLGGMIAPSRIRKFIIKLLQRAGGF